MRQDWRVEFVCGGRAELVARQDFHRLQAVAEKLNCAPEELVTAAERAVSERDRHFKRTHALLQRLAEIEAAQAVREAVANSGGVRIIQRVFEGVEPEFPGYFAAEVAKTEKAVALLARLGCGHLVFAQHPSTSKDMSALLKQVLAKLGGKGGGTRDFARGKLDVDTNAGNALALARELLSGHQPAV
jgi:alanyl-tRNA synthetase